MGAGPDNGNPPRTLGWLSLGIGGVGLIAGGIADYKGTDVFPTIGFAIGGVGVVTGLVLLLSSGSSDEEQAAGVTPWVGLGSAGVPGRF